METCYPCPKCDGREIKGYKSPMLNEVTSQDVLHLVRCEKCGHAYNGYTGQSHGGMLGTYYLWTGLIIGMFFFMAFYGMYLDWRYNRNTEIDIPSALVPIFDALTMEDIAIKLDFSSLLPAPTNVYSGEGSKLAEGANQGDIDRDTPDSWSYTAVSSQTISLQLDAAESTMLMIRDSAGVMLDSTVNQNGTQSQIRGLRLSGGKTYTIDVMGSTETNYTVTLTRIN